MEPQSATPGRLYLRRASGGAAGSSSSILLLPIHGEQRPPGMESLGSGVKKKATEHHYRAEVMIAGEQLR